MGLRRGPPGLSKRSKVRSHYAISDQTRPNPPRDELAVGARRGMIFRAGREALIFNYRRRISHFSRGANHPSQPAINGRRAAFGSRATR
jgi:hypothetical protein